MLHRKANKALTAEDAKDAEERIEVTKRHLRWTPMMHRCSLGMCHTLRLASIQILVIPPRPLRPPRLELVVVWSANVTPALYSGAGGRT
jgi:hypothetical protein